MEHFCFCIVPIEMSAYRFAHPIFNLKRIFPILFQKLVIFRLGGPMKQALLLLFFRIEKCQGLRNGRESSNTLQEQLIAAEIKELEGIAFYVSDSPPR